jgi:predicted small lipoprotein YifL
MNGGRAAAALAVLAILLLGLSGCGQMGPLTLPDDVGDDQEPDSDDQNER